VKQRGEIERTTLSCISLHTLSSFPLTSFFGMAFSKTWRMTSAASAEGVCADVWVVEEETEKNDDREGLCQ
jgi:hypothetical protein